jgi:membrane-associated phospholipid phosphatase
VEPLPQRIKTYCFWGVVSGIVFFSVYPTCNWLTSLRSDPYQFYLQSELAVPFLPEWIWVYLSMYVLFLAPPFFLDCGGLARLGKQLITTTLAAGFTYLLVPATLGFERVAPENGFLRDFYLKIFEVDKPHNLIPSLHVIWSTALALAVVEKATPPWRLFFLGWAAAIALSTLFVHQHHVIDLVVAVVFVMVARMTIRE